MSTLDPDMEETVARTAADKSKDVEHDEPTEDDQEDFTAPTEWWFASTACPLLAATFGPMANGFSICALVYSWRMYIPPGEAPAFGVALPDPKWLVAINAVSLAFALIGNLTLLLNMAKRLKFSVAQPMTIAGFFMAGVLLIVDMAILSSSSTYFITEAKAIPAANHALTSAFYYAVWAAAIYLIVGSLMCLTVYGAIVGHYKRDFQLTPSQRTLMLQTMCYIGYWLLGALVFSHIEGWEYLDAVYWAQVTLLTIGFGDYYPVTNLGRGLLFPYAIIGILTVGMVVGSIRSLVLERGEQKIGARITEKRRETAINNVDARKQTIQISWFAKAEFSTDPSMTPAQRREEEFNVMRRVQKVAERQKRYFGLASSLFIALLLWFLGAAIFMVCERESKWTYFQGVYFTFVSLVTIGYGDITPSSNAGKAFFVLWSMLAIPSLTILISNMGDTIVKWVSDVTELVAKFTILPEKKKSVKGILAELTGKTNAATSKFTGPGLLGAASGGGERNKGHQHYQEMLERLAQRLESHIEREELEAARRADDDGDFLERDIRFYHYVLSRESRNVQKDLSKSPPKEYTWHEWEYFLKLMGSGSDSEDEGFPDEPHSDALVPDAMKVDHGLTGDFEKDHSDAKPAFPSPSSNSSTVEADKDGIVDRQTEKKNKLAWHGPKKLRRNKTNEDPLTDWSWLSEESPLMSQKSESEWILERLSAALVRELNRERKGCRKKPPISMLHVVRASEMHEKHKEAEKQGHEKEADMARKEETKAVLGES